MKKQLKYLFDKHIKSFLKTFVTVFLGVLLFAYDQNIDVFALPFIVSCLKVSLISVLRNVYKFVTEGDVERLK